jgi:methylmalonyl-CoA mutase
MPLYCQLLLNLKRRSCEDKIFLNLLLNQFDKVKMDLDPYNWEIILTWNEK